MEVQLVKIYKKEDEIDVKLNTEATNKKINQQFTQIYKLAAEVFNIKNVDFVLYAYAFFKTQPICIDYEKSKDDLQFVREYNLHIEGFSLVKMTSLNNQGIEMDKENIYLDFFYRQYFEHNDLVEIAELCENCGNHFNLCICDKNFSFSIDLSAIRDLDYIREIYYQDQDEIKNLEIKIYYFLAHELPFIEHDVGQKIVSDIIDVIHEILKLNDESKKGRNKNRFFGGLLVPVLFHSTSVENKVKCIQIISREYDSIDYYDKKIIYDHLPNLFSSEDWLYYFDHWHNKKNKNIELLKKLSESPVINVGILTMIIDSKPFAVYENKNVTVDMINQAMMRRLKNPTPIPSGVFYYALDKMFRDEKFNFKHYDQLKQEEKIILHDLIYHSFYQFIGALSYPGHHYHYGKNVFNNFYFTNRNYKRKTADLGKLQEFFSRCFSDEILFFMWEELAKYKGEYIESEYFFVQIIASIMQEVYNRIDKYGNDKFFMNLNKILKYLPYRRHGLQGHGMKDFLAEYVCKSSIIENPYAIDTIAYMVKQASKNHVKEEFHHACKDFGDISIKLLKNDVIRKNKVVIENMWEFENRKQKFRIEVAKIIAECGKDAVTDDIFQSISNSNSEDIKKILGG